MFHMPPPLSSQLYQVPDLPSSLEIELRHVETPRFNQGGQHRRTSSSGSTTTSQSASGLSQYLVSTVPAYPNSPRVFQAESGAWITITNPVEMLESKEQTSVSDSGGHNSLSSVDQVEGESDKREPSTYARGKEREIPGHSGPPPPPPPLTQNNFPRGAPPPPPPPSWAGAPRAGPSRAWPLPGDSSDSSNSSDSSHSLTSSHFSSMDSSGRRGRREGKNDEQKKREEPPDIKPARPTTPPQAPRAASEVSIRRPGNHPYPPRDEFYGPQVKLNLIWMSQMDVFHGFWATPWLPVLGNYPETLHTWCLTQSVIIDALSRLTEITYGQYADNHREWLAEGKSTWPPYAINSKNGVVVGGNYQGTNFEMFSHPLPAIKLLHNEHHQHKLELEYSTTSIIERQVELTYLDSWLSLCGRLPEIDFGPAGIIESAPLRIDAVIYALAPDLVTLHFSANKGGSQEIAKVADKLISTIEYWGMGKAEQVFFYVGLLRTIKVAICIIMGPSTSRVMSVLESETPVFLV